MPRCTTIQAYRRDLLSYLGIILDYREKSFTLVKISLELLSLSSNTTNELIELYFTTKRCYKASKSTDLKLAESKAVNAEETVDKITTLQPAEKTQILQVLKC